MEYKIEVPNESLKQKSTPKLEPKQEQKQLNVK